MRLSFIILFILAINTCFAQTLTSGGKLKPEQAIMDVRHYTIALNVDIPQKSISGYTIIDVVLSQSAPVLLFDLMNDLQVQSVWVNGKKTPFTHSNMVITVNPASPLAAGKASVKIQYAGAPHIAVNPPWGDGFTWTTDSLGHPWVAITAEGIGGKIYFPCKDHPSDEPNEGVDMIITVPKGLVVAGPGLLQNVAKQKTTDTYHWKTNYTINNYSIVFNVGDYKLVSRTYNSINGTTIPMQFYVLSYHADRAAHHLDILASMVKVKEKYFGEYPWAKEKIGIVETPHLGMEHQTMNAYGNKFRYASIGGQDFDWLMNHEFGHEWWGNKVTAKDWADYWIHEGIETFGDQLFVLDAEGEKAYNQQFRDMVPGIMNNKPIVQGKDIDEEAAYIGDIYDKGAFFLHTLRYIIGDSIFFPTLKQLATSSHYTYDSLVNTEEVEALFNKNSGIDLGPLFDFYLRTTKKLDIHVTRLRNDYFKIRIDNFDGPLPVDIVTSSGKERITLNTKGISIKSTSQPEIDPDGYYLKRLIIE